MRDGRRADAPALDLDEGLQVVPRPHQARLRPGRVGDRRPERLGQVEHHRRRALGARRAVPARGARPVDEGRDLRRRPRLPSPQRGRGRGRDRQLGRRARSPTSREISIVRRLDRDGEGEYRLNGARCRLVDVLEVLSDTGLGKEMHSVVSQGRVEAIIHSKPRDRRLLIEEAAGLGKHRKRRRRAQLKLERTEENLDRAARRGARGALAAAAAEAPGRGRRAARAARAPVARGALRAAPRDDVRVARAQSWPRPRPRPPRRAAERDEAERLLAEVAARREAAEQAFAEHSRAREALASRAVRGALRRRADRDAPRAGARPGHRCRRGRGARDGGSST